MKRHLITFIAILFLSKLYCQPTIQWQNTIGGDTSDYLYWNSIKQTYDGGYILGGTSISDSSGNKNENSLGSFDFWIVKLDSAGNILWQNTIGGSDEDLLYSIDQTIDHGYIIGGGSKSSISGDKSQNSFGLHDYWVIKLDSLGDIEWQGTYGGSQNDYLRDVHQTSDGGYILGGLSSSDSSGNKSENNIGAINYWVLKLDSFGNIIWQNTIGGNFNDLLNSIEQTSDGGYILGGNSNSDSIGDKTQNCWKSPINNPTMDYWIVKLDTLGNIQWQKTYGGNYTEFLGSIRQTFDNGYILGGYSDSDLSGDKSESSNGGPDFWALKLDSIGNIEWQNTIGGSDFDALHSAKQTFNAGYILGGYSKSNISGDKTENCKGLYDYWIVSVDSIGNVIWQKTIGGASEDVLLSIEQTFDLGFILGGYSSSDSSGDKSENALGSYDYWIIKLNASHATGQTESKPIDEDFIITPNPFRSIISLELSTNVPSLVSLNIHDLFGRKLHSNKYICYPAKQNYSMDLTHLPRGIYLLTVDFNKRSINKKIIKF